jgi:hypothetical protein
MNANHAAVAPDARNPTLLYNDAHDDQFQIELPRIFRCWRASFDD